MSVLFTPQSIGKVNIKNRFVQSATYEGRVNYSRIFICSSER